MQSRFLQFGRMIVPLSATLAVGELKLGAASAPMPQIVAPQNGQSLSQAGFQITANTPQPVRSIELLTDGRTFAKGQSSSGLTNFEATWRDPSGGDHILSAVATDLSGSTRTSSPVAIRVVAGEFEPWNFEFQLSFGFVGTLTNRPTNVISRSYSFNGPRQPGPLLPAMRLTPDPGSRRYGYGVWQHLPYQLDSVTGAAKVFAPPQISPGSSWLVGFTTDTKRGTVVLASLGGEGTFYSYALHEDQWKQFGSLNNVDLRTFVYHPPNDSFYGLDNYRMVLYRFTGEGRYVSARSLPPLPATGSSLLVRTELVSVGAFIVLLSQEYYSGLPGQVVHQFIDAIDVANDMPRLTYAGSFVAPSTRAVATAGRFKLMIASEEAQEFTLPTDGGLQLESTLSLNPADWERIQTESSLLVKPTNSQQFFRLAPRQ